MADYISRDDVLKAIDYQHEVNHVFESEAAYVHMWETINDDITIKAAEVQPVDSWIAVTEKLPEIDKYVLIYYPYWTDNEIQVARLCYDKLTFDICGEFNASVNKVTHWRPLPEPPKDGDTE